MGEIRLPQSEVVIRAENLDQGPSELPLDSSFVYMSWGKLVPFCEAAANRGEKLAELCFLNIKRASLDSRVVKESRIRLLPELPFHYPSAARQGKYFSETSPKKESRSRRLSRQPRDNPLQLNVDFLVLAKGYSLGITGSRISAGCNGRKRVGVKDFSLERTGHKTQRRPSKDATHMIPSSSLN
jgi:hypothetical protein